MVYLNSSTSNWTTKFTLKSNVIKRTVVGLSLLAYFALALFVGPPFIITNTLIIQIRSFQEVMNIALRLKKLPHIPYFVEFVWYAIILANYFCFVETFAQYTQVIINKYWLLRILVDFHKIISLLLYFLGLIFFLVTLKKEFMLQQYTLLFWIHFLTIILTVQSYLFIQNLYEGLIWLMIPFLSIIINDIFAYFVGKNFGKTPLITLSPNKTVEGFVGGGIFTVLLGLFLAHIFCHYDYLVCPIKYYEADQKILRFTNCTRNYLFQPIVYHVAYTNFSLNYYPFLQHALYLTLFASIVAPFGGFFASGFKRAVDIKDFGNIIPGHGGFMDRFDCYFLMGTFVNVYISTFIKERNIEDITTRMNNLTLNEKLKLFSLLKSALNE
ncbi:phosphatidate cytidylyltransferase, photoreceptor-specific-like [Diorhabda carinulata]|uniref:phosphatidate cytidylyltransferase, photoreceptor-specific-like n=1 Tax=Diorhabda carinulata TaxID=1163345 RepID=UPI0025A02588|nr:phosphatidate cytidylyltransferase, photoreceptor-specific-like [Diorhabda carinulata]